MLRSSLFTSALILTCASASAQSQQVQARQQLGPVRDAGIYHVSTGTWTRNPGAQANLGPDVIYNASAPSGYFGTGWEGAEGVDEIRLPGTDASGVNVGTQDCYAINGFDFTYCSTSTNLVNWEFNFYDAYTPCDDPDNPVNPINNVLNFPAPSLPANGFCWIVTFDLEGGGEFDMVAENSATPGYDGAGLNLDHGGIGAIFTGTSSGALTGPLLAGGDPNWSPQGEGTCYNGTITCAAGFTGLGHQDLFGAGAPLSGCFFFGGYNNTNGCGGPSQGPSAAFAYTLFTDCAVGGSCDGGDCPDNVYCTTATSPNNTSTIAISDCALGNNPVITMSNGPDGFAGYLLIGDGQNVVVSPPDAKGDLCVAGGCIGRYTADLGVISGGQLSTDLINGNTGGGTGAIPNPCGGTLAAGATWNFQYWHRQPQMQESTFSEAITVTFQ